MSDPADELGALITAAAAHGNASEREHEVGDLQQLLWLCWRHLTPRGRERVIGDPLCDELRSWED